jgi:hypothetical protein
MRKSSTLSQAPCSQNLLLWPVSRQKLTGRAVQPRQVMALAIRLSDWGQVNYRLRAPCSPESFEDGWCVHASDHAERHRTDVTLMPTGRA